MILDECWGATMSYEVTETRQALEMQLKGIVFIWPATQQSMIEREEKRGGASAIAREETNQSQEAG